MAVVMERVEGMEKLLLGAFAAGQKLHVIEDERIDAAKLVLELAHLVAPQRTDELVHEDLRRHEQDLAPLIARRPQMMTDRRRQMGLAETHTAVNEERIILLTRLVGRGLRRRVGELIARADDELRKGIARRQSRMQLAPRRLGRRAGRGGAELRLGRIRMATAGRRAVATIPVNSIDAFAVTVSVAIAGQCCVFA